MNEIKPNWDNNYEWGTNIYLLNPDSGVSVKRNYNLVICKYCNKPVEPKIVTNPRGTKTWISSQAHNKKRYCDKAHKKIFEATRDYVPVTRIFPLTHYEKFLNPGMKNNFVDYMAKA